MNSLQSRLERWARTKPSAIALGSRDQSLTYAGLTAAVQQLASQLSRHRVKSLGLYLDNGIDWIVIDLAAMAAGIRVVPLPWFFSDQQIEHAIEAGLVSHLAVADDLPAGIVGTGVRAKLYADSWLQSIVTKSESSNSSISGKVSFTSGSTGTPKGIELDYEFIDQTCASLVSAISSLGIETHLSILPYATLLENIAGVYLPLMLGKTVYAVPSERVGLSADLQINPVKLQQCFNRIQPDSLILTPQLLELFCLLVENRAIDPECLVFVAVGGARVGETLLQRARSAGIPAYEGYGLTEFGSVALLNTPCNDRPGSVGKPLPGVSVEIAEDGEILLGRAVMGSTQLATGDLGSIDADGYISVHGRKSNLIVLPNGRNVAPEWVETEINASPLIMQSYLFAETGSELSALLQVNGPEVADCDLDVEIDRINRGLPAYARVNRWYRLEQPFSRANHMLTANGRLRRAHINQLLPTLLASTRSPLSMLVAEPPNFQIQETNPC
jgi:long-chain acyl-CoA synthetase